MRRGLQALLFVLSAAYPFVWHFGRGQGWFDCLAAGMLLLWSCRALFAREAWQKAAAAALAGLFALLLVLRLPAGMYWYPVAVNVLMLGMFGSSLFAKQSLIERIARLQTPELPARAVAYTRKVTQIWCVFFIANGSIAAALAASGQHQWWALYTGVIAYVLMGVLLGGEWLYRKRILKV
ncbi:membrane protein [Conchiformibius kuhniae]|uniref:DNA gyrase subunit B n=1 Tax=Conchiformibius kuhniae TaxID=211502 RepID=A0A8T9N144_9NEIS|nr:membrane protein [Conchiformibius kuhniae]UOP05703.1 hypothetical protein LVJ77_10585 [Conchiformibius kuhniae]